MKSGRKLMMGQVSPCTWRWKDTDIHGQDLRTLRVDGNNDREVCEKHCYADEECNAFVVWEHEYCELKTIRSPDGYAQLYNAATVWSNTVEHESISRRDYFIMDGACKEKRAPKPKAAKSEL